MTMAAQVWSSAFRLTRARTQAARLGLHPSGCLLPPCRLKPELHACFGGMDRHATVGAALCGRPSLPRRGAPTDLPMARGAGIFIGDTQGTEISQRHQGFSVHLRALRVSVVNEVLEFLLELKRGT